MAEQPAREGNAVAEGQMLRTGADGFLYVKTIDNGLFILRPNTEARIATYHVDAGNPANTRIKLELLSGVARSKSGNAVKQARQNFRFNTPVAAIGVRGTDFTVFTDDTTSRVAVVSGAIVMSGFAGACQPNGIGPCEGSASRELSAAQRGQLLQLQRGQSAPQLIQSNPLSPDQVSPPRADEPLARTGNAGGGTHVNLDPEKTANLNNAIANVPVPVAPAVPAPPAVIPIPMPVPEPVPVPVPVAVADLPERGIVWGRWQTVAGLAPNIILSLAQQQNQLVAAKGNYVLLRSPGDASYIAPNNGSIGFQLRDSEAFVYADYTPAYRVETPATLSNGTLNVDFGSKTFSTSVDLNSSVANLRLQANGAVGADGGLYGEAANGRVGYINVQGLLSRQNGGSAVYIFDGRLDERRTLNGVTSWQKAAR